MATPILFIHSAGTQAPGQGSNALVVHLRSQLEPAYRLICPAMPSPENPDYRAWKFELEKQLDRIDNQMILIGHSLGGSVILKYLSEVPGQKSIAGIFTIASPFFGKNGWDVNDFAFKSSLGTNLSSIPNIYLYHSQDDSVVPIEHVNLYKKAIVHAKTSVLEGYGHLFDRPCAPLISHIKSVPLTNEITIRPTRTMITSHISETLQQVTEDFLNTMQEIDDLRLNEIPFEGSWTAGQVAEHLIKSEKDLPAILTEPTEPTIRKADEKVPILESIFLDFSTKLNAPDFIIPSAGPFDKQDLMDTLKAIRNELTQIVAKEDLSLTCTGTSFPGLGKLTRWEWINFVIVHCKRHTRQLKNIQSHLSQTTVP